MTSIMKKIDEMQDEIVNFMVDMIRIKAVNPVSGGEGELKRGEWLEKKLKEICDEVKRYDAIDERGLKRPNIVGIIFGEDRSRTLWIISHIDTVPEGDLSLWSHDPYDPVVKDGKIYGRGTLDDGQGVVSSYFAAKAIVESGKRPKINLGLVFVSDEEAGSRYGVHFLMDKDIFMKDDLIVVPDSGNSDGSFVEIAEKGSVWLKITTQGKQSHASMPHLGLNAHRVGMRFALKVDDYLHNTYNGKNPLFEPPYSTFEITKKEKNVDNVNTIPGTDVFYFDFRILPEYEVDKIIEDVKTIAEEVSSETGAKINVEIVQKGEPSQTPKDSEIVKKLERALRELRGIEPRIGGIGGGTVAAAFRKVGIPAVVWMTADDVEHQPDEFCRIENLVNDAKVFAYLAMDGEVE